MYCFCVIAAVWGVAVPALAADITVNTKASFLSACEIDTGAQSPLVITLSDYNISPGSVIRLAQIGDARTGFSSPNNTDIFSRGLMGAFSASTTIADPSNLNRITGALDAGVDTVTPMACEGASQAISSDVSYDFYIAGSAAQLMPLGTTYTDILVPTGAVYLFVCMYDLFYGDNSDPDSDFMLRRTSTACRGDWNNSGSISVQDIYDFETSYFAGNGDFNQNGLTSI